MKRNEKYSLLLLAGGKSSRMGRNKAELLYEGKTFAELLINKGIVLGIEEIYVSGFSYLQKEWADGVQVPMTHTSESGSVSFSEKLYVVWDQYQDRGPLGGMHACMKKMNTPYCLVLPVDAPMLPQTILERLLEYHEKIINRKNNRVPVLIWEHGDRKEPLIAVYPTAIASKIEDLIQSGPAPVFRLLDCWGYDCLRMELEQPQVINVNTPQLYMELLNSGSIEGS